MFFCSLFKNKKGNKEAISEGIFGIAVVCNVVCLATALMLLLGCFFVETKNIENLIIIACLIIVGCYVVEVFLAWTSAILNKEAKEEVKLLNKSKKEKI